MLLIDGDVTLLNTANRVFRLVKKPCRWMLDWQVLSVEVLSVKALCTKELRYRSVSKCNQ